MKFTNMILWILGIYMFYYLVIIFFDKITSKRKNISNEDITYSISQKEEDSQGEEIVADVVNENEFMVKKKLHKLPEIIDCNTSSNGAYKVTDFINAMKQSTMEGKMLFAGVRGI